MKIKIICPRWPGRKPLAPLHLPVFPYLSLTTLAALTPREIEVVIEDENVQEVSFDDRPDLVAVSIMTPLAKRGYAIADRFREKSVPVVHRGVPCHLAARRGRAACRTPWF